MLHCLTCGRKYVLYICIKRKHNRWCGYVHGCVHEFVCAEETLMGEAKQVKETIMKISAVRGVLVNLYELTFEGEANPWSRLLQGRASVNT